MVTTKQTGLSERLVYDGHERRSGLVRLLPIGTTPKDFADATARDLVRSFDGAWAVESLTSNRLTATYEERGVRITKTIEIGGDRSSPSLSVEVVVANDGDTLLEGLLGVEFAVMLLGGGHNPGAWYEIAGDRFAHDGRRVAEGITALRAANEQLGVAVDTGFDAPADAWIAPIETVSNSEAGFELVYQGSAALFVRPIRLSPGEAASSRVSHIVTVGSLVPAGTRGSAPT
jgi:alpha-amylase